MRKALTIALLCALLISSLAIAEPFPRIRFSLPPVYEALPVAFAQEWGLFAEHGLDVELLGFSDLDERSAALHAGYLDGLMSDVTHALMNASTGLNLVITAAATTRPQTGSITLGLVSSDLRSVENVEQLLASSHTIGVVRRSDHEYLLDRLVAGIPHGATATARIAPLSDILLLATYVALRMQPYAVLPEPYITYLATNAPAGQAPIQVVTLADFGEITIPPSLVVFRRSFVDAHPDAVIAFHAAYNEAVRRLNESSRQEIIDTGLSVAVSLFFKAANVELIGQDVLDALPIPVFAPLGCLDEQMYDDVARWMGSKRYLFGRLPSYADLFDGRLLP